MTSTDPTVLDKEIEALLVRVEREYGDIRFGRDTLGERAAAMLSEVRNLGIGKPCPEIAGEDLDGKSFKLSDYRGKVVVIDFWGDW
jgi:AhpC/TSA family